MRVRELENFGAHCHALGFWLFWLPLLFPHRRGILLAPTARAIGAMVAYGHFRSGAHAIRRKDIARIHAHRAISLPLSHRRPKGLQKV
uniref:Uncharacterized protein n=1 Tax=Physcomitrium patens TaxID=3218 RepID=A0A2K1KVX4_PHYPA|nr:hypothetical protein PHYPA_004917 [Physcomitrium patens]